MQPIIRYPSQFKRTPSTYQLNIPKQLYRVNNPQRGLKQVQSLLQQQIQSEKCSISLLQQTYNRQIKRIKMLNDQSNRKLLVMIDQQKNLILQRQQLIDNIKQAKGKLNVFSKTPQVNQRLTKLDQLRYMQQQIQQHVRIQQSKLAGQIHQQQAKRSKQLQVYKQKLNEALEKKHKGRKQKTKIQHKLKLQNNKPVITKYQRRQDLQQLFIKQIDSLSTKISNFELSRSKASVSLSTSKQVFLSTLKQQLKRIKQLKMSILIEKLDTIEWQRKISDQTQINDYIQKKIQQKQKQIQLRENEIQKIQILSKQTNGYFQQEVDNYKIQKNPFFSLNQQIYNLQSKVRQIRGQNFRLKAGYQRVGQVVSSKISLGILKDLVQVQKGL